MPTDDELLQPQMDLDAYLRGVLRISNPEAELARLQQCTDRVYGTIQEAIGTRVEPMLHLVEGSGELLKSVEQIRVTAVSMQNVARRLHHTITEPFQTASKCVRQVENALAAEEMLRLCQKFLSAASRLTEAADRADYLRAARFLKETDDLLSTGRLAGINCVEAAFPAVTAASAKVRSKVVEGLRTALAEQRAGDAAVSLQCLSLMGTLSKTVWSIVQDNRRDAIAAIVRGLSANALSAAAEEGPKSASLAQRQRDGVLRCVEEVLREIGTKLSLVGNLWRILDKKRDGNMKSLGDSVEGFDKGIIDVWTAVSTQLRDTLSRCNRHSTIGPIMGAEYSRFRKLLSGWLQNLMPFLQLIHIGKPAAQAKRLAGTISSEWVAAVVESHEKVFTSTLYDRYREKVQPVVQRLNSVLPNDPNAVIDVSARQEGAIPAAAHPLEPSLRSLLKTILQDIAAYRPDPVVFAITLRQVFATLGVLVTKMSAVQSKALQTKALVWREHTAAQLALIGLSNAAMLIVSDVSAGTTYVGGTLEANADVDAGMTKIREALAQLSSVVESVVRPLFSSAQRDFLSLVVAYLTDSAGARATDVQREQLESKAIDFRQRCVNLLDPESMAVGQSKKALVHGVSLRAVVVSLTLRPAGREAMAAAVEKVATGVVGVWAASERITPTVLKLRAAISLLRTSDVVSGVRTYSGVLHPLLLALHLMQSLPPEVVSPWTSMGVSFDKYCSIVEDILSGGAEPPTRIIDAMTTSFQRSATLIDPPVWDLYRQLVTTLETPASTTP